MKKIIADLGTPVFSVCAVLDPEKSTFEDYTKLLDTKLRNLLELSDVEEYIFFLDGRNNFRKYVYTGYKANRKDKVLPPFLQELKQYAVDKWGAHMPDGLEADDAVSITYYHYAEKEKDSTIFVASVDKDLLQIPGEHIKLSFKSSSNEFIEVTDKEANRYLFNQMITGDSTDGIAGIKGYGIKKVDSVFEGKFTERKFNGGVSRLQEIDKAYIYLLEEYLKVYGTKAGLDWFAKNWLCLSMLRKPDYNFEVPAWKQVQL